MMNVAALVAFLLPVASAFQAATVRAPLIKSAVRPAVTMSAPLVRRAFNTTKEHTGVSRHT